MDCESEKKTEVCVAHGSALPPLRTPPRVYAEVSNVPYLFPRTGLGWQDSGRDEGELVRKI